MTRYRLVLAGGLIAMSLSACGWSQPPRAQIAEEAAGTFSAAAATLAGLHGGRLTRQFATASFEAFREQATANLTQLRGLGIGTGAEEAIERGAGVLDAPCLDSDCDWRVQLASLREAVRTLLATAGP